MWHVTLLQPDAILGSKCTQNAFVGSAPDPAGELTVLPHPLAVFEGAASRQGRGGEGREMDPRKFENRSTPMHDSDLPVVVMFSTPTTQNSSQATTAAVPHSYYQQHYYPNYQPFYNSSAAAWWSLYQQPAAGYYCGQYPDSSFAYSTPPYYVSPDYSVTTGYLFTNFLLRQFPF